MACFGGVRQVGTCRTARKGGRGGRVWGRCFEAKFTTPRLLLKGSRPSTSRARAAVEVRNTQEPHKRVKGQGVPPHLPP